MVVCGKGTADPAGEASGTTLFTDGIHNYQNQDDVTEMGIKINIPTSGEVDVLFDVGTKSLTPCIREGVADKTSFMNVTGSRRAMWCSGFPVFWHAFFRQLQIWAEFGIIYNQRYDYYACIRNAERIT